MNDQPTPAPMTAKKRVTIFSPWAKKMVSVKPYSSSAKKLYRYYIQEFEYDPSWQGNPRERHGRPSCRRRTPASGSTTRLSSPPSHLVNQV